MHLLLSSSQRQEQRQEQRFTLEQRLQIANAMFTLRMDLMEAVNGERFEPRAVCPQCEYSLAPTEILNGFNQDPTDYQTTCPKCRRRFEPRLRRFERAGSTEVPFYCPTQTLAQLRSCQPLPFEEFRRQYPAVCHSAKVHFGTLTNAFKKIGILYTQDENRDWKEKIVGYLGKLPDTVIAKCVNASARTIRILRKKHRIPSFSRDAFAC